MESWRKQKNIWKHSFEKCDLIAKIITKIKFLQLKRLQVHVCIQGTDSNQWLVTEWRNKVVLWGAAVILRGQR